MSENTGGPAFPSHGDFGEVAHEGMTLRQYLAGKALAGFCANSAVFAESRACGWSLVNCSPEQLAEECLKLADAVIEASNK